MNVLIIEYEIKIITIHTLYEMGLYGISNSSLQRVENNKFADLHVTYCTVIHITYMSSGNCSLSLYLIPPNPHPNSIKCRRSNLKLVVISCSELNTI